MVGLDGQGPRFRGVDIGMHDDVRARFRNGESDVDLSRVGRPVRLRDAEHSTPKARELISHGRHPSYETRRRRIGCPKPHRFGFTKIAVKPWVLRFFLPGHRVPARPQVRWRRGCLRRQLHGARRRVLAWPPRTPWRPSSDVGRAGKSFQRMYGASSRRASVPDQLQVRPGRRRLRLPDRSADYHQPGAPLTVRVARSEGAARSRRRPPPGSS